MKIKKNHHYPTPFEFPKLFFNKNYLKAKKTICFDDSFKYDIDTDQTDINKMFGFSYGYHHHNSDRIGWRYTPNKNQVEILLYSYDQKKVIKKHITFVDLNDVIKIGLTVIKDHYTKERNVIVYLYQNNSFSHFNYVFYCPSSVINYSLGWYFGGNRCAPHNIKIKQF